MNRSFANFTVDVEKPYSDGEKGVYEYLEVFEKCRVKATFFVTGDVASDTPKIVKAILNSGHEVGSHGLTHPYIGHVPREWPEFLISKSDLQVERELIESKQILEELGASVKGFRAPWFRTNRSVLDCVAKHFRYDSSSASNNGMEIMSKDFYKMPVSKFPMTSIPIGTPILFGYIPEVILGPIITNIKTTPLTLYGHSFDLVKCSSRLYTSSIKRMWYFNRCGPDKKKFLIRLISELQKKFSFVRIDEFIDSCSG